MNLLQCGLFLQMLKFKNVSIFLDHFLGLYVGLQEYSWMENFKYIFGVGSVLLAGWK